jgi:hypothetical protein
MCTLWTASLKRSIGILPGRIPYTQVMSFGNALEVMYNRHPGDHNVWTQHTHSEYKREFLGCLYFELFRLTDVEGHPVISCLVILPYWFVVPPLMVAPLIFAERRLRRMRKRAGGFCVVCGDDLRATPRRCPECGTEISLTHR